VSNPTRAAVVAVRALIVVLGIALSLAGAEAWVRWWKPKPPVQIVRNNSLRVIDGVPVWEWTTDRKPRECAEAHPERQRILFLGSSITQRLHHPGGGHLNFALERRLNELRPNPGFCVMNFAQPGFTSQQKLTLGSEEIPRYRPALVMWEGWNEFGSWSLIGSSAYELRRFALRSDGFPGLPGVPDALIHTLFERSRFYELMTLSFGAKTVGDSEMVEARVRLTRLVALTRSAGARLGMYICPPLNRPFREAQEPFIPPSPGLEFARLHGIPYVVLAHELEGQDYLVLRANRLLLTAIGLAMPYATRELLVALGGDERLALFGCAAFWCRPLVIGFLPFMAAVPVTIYVLALVARQCAAPTFRRAALLAAFALLVFYLHLDPFFLIVAVALALNLAPRAGAPEAFGERLARLPARLAWLAPGAMAACVWLLRAHASAGLAFMGEGPVSFLSAEQLAAEFPVWAHGIWRSHVEEVTGAASWGLLLALAFHRQRPEPGGLRGLLVRFVPFACAALLFALVPFRVGVARMLNVRFAVFLLPTLLVVFRPDPGRTTDAILAAVALVTACVAGHAVLQVRGAERDELAGVDALLAKVSPGARLLSLEFSRDSSFTQFPPWTKVGALHRLRGGGVASVSFAEVPHWPIHFRPELQPPQVPGRDLEWHPCEFRNSFDGPYFDYVLVRGDIDPFGYAPPGPTWRRLERAVERRGPPWTLFERMAGPTAAVVSPDPGPCSPSRFM
jgi:hypothetical protein